MLSQRHHDLQLPAGINVKDRISVGMNMIDSELLENEISSPSDARIVGSDAPGHPAAGKIPDLIEQNIPERGIAHDQISVELQNRTKISVGFPLFPMQKLYLLDRQHGGDCRFILGAPLPTLLGRY